MNTEQAIIEFNKFANKHELIYTKDTWTGDWDESDCITIFKIHCEYYYEDYEKDNVHINYNGKYWGSLRFNEWLNKFGFCIEWDSEGLVSVYIRDEQDMRDDENEDEYIARLKLLFKK
jgi:hypothetical protein